MNDLVIKIITSYKEDAFELFLLADPSYKQINSYIQKSVIYGAYLNDILIASYALLPVNELTVEIKNIAVSENVQRKGVGTLLLEHAKETAISMGFKQITIGTANSSIYQLLFYQKCGFELFELKKHFFTDNYPEPIFENGIQAKHIIMLSYSL